MENFENQQSFNNLSDDTIAVNPPEPSASDADVPSVGAPLAAAEANADESPEEQPESNVSLPDDFIVKRPADPPVTYLGISPDEMAKREAQAELRGYRRGRNERISDLMQSPSLWENTCRGRTIPSCYGLDHAVGDDASDSVDGFLSTLRPGIWD